MSIHINEICVVLGCFYPNPRLNAIASTCNSINLFHLIRAYICSYIACMHSGWNWLYHCLFQLSTKERPNIIRKIRTPAPEYIHFISCTLLCASALNIDNNNNYY